MDINNSEEAKDRKIKSINHLLFIRQTSNKNAYDGRNGAHPSLEMVQNIAENGAPIAD